MDFKSKVTELALAAGGAHYPEVNRMQLDAYTKLVVAECISALEQAERDHVRTTFDQEQFEFSMFTAGKAINERFGL